MSGREDMDPAYAESLAGQFEILEHSLRRFLKKTYAELGKILDPTDPTVASDDRPDVPAPAAGDIRVRGRCTDSGCSQGAPHYHSVIINPYYFGLSYTAGRRPPAESPGEPDPPDRPESDRDRSVSPGGVKKPGIRQTVTISTGFGEEVHWAGCPRTFGPSGYCDCV